ncbi:MAG TPA: serine hydrolase domain-containing protein [Bryobacteraceae bacterium]|nr:serine hydrolase domain-containing protein [Bryobacteraceae bacterium]
MQRRDFLLGGMAVALQRHKLDEAAALIEHQVASGEVRAASLAVQQGSFRLERAFGQAKSPETIFLLASITKPMTVTAVMILSDRGRLSLSDPVRRYIPEFQGGERDRITIQHLVTHTSGLPDMLPENEDLRRRHAPLKDFVAGTCRTPLLFRPGAEVRYQSMGILLAAEIVERITATPLRVFLHRELFEPLGMRRTALGLGDFRIPETAQCQVTGNDDWNWNSPYWRDLGAPWGGAHSTAPDVMRFLAAFLHPDGRMLKRETAAAMIANHTQPLPVPWGLGWMIQPGKFGKGCSPRTFGHYGSTGTVAWADPASGLSCVLLTTKPAEQSRAHLLGPVSDLVSESARQS